MAPDPIPTYLDAYQQLDVLRRRYTREFRTLPDGHNRPDLSVVAGGLERAVFVGGEQHNVNTIREFIKVLELACDFVEGANSGWAGKRRRITGAVTPYVEPENDW